MSKRKTASEMATIVRLSESRKTSIEVFCAEQRISTGVYYYWRNRLKRKRNENGFVPLQLRESNSSMEETGQGLSVYHGELEIRFDRLPPVDYLSKLFGLHG